jgi:hypothetical protein
MLEKLEAVLKPHAMRTGETIEQFFNRQLHERIVGERLAQPVANVRLLQLSNAEVNIVEELWSTGQLKVFPPWHTINKPAQTDVPLVVFRGWSKLYLIDGQKRVNLWISTENSEPHRVLVVEPKANVSNPFKT